MLTVIERGLRDFSLEIHHVDGTLTFGFAQTHIATVTTQDGAVSLVAEHRSPLARPRGKGRTASIQPDFVLTDQIGAPEKTRIVVETKQYKQPNVQNFANALVDYARGHPNARVVLADYGPMSPRVLGCVLKGILPRAVAVGDVRPRSAQAIGQVQDAILGAMPPPPKRDALSDVTLKEADTIVVDVSASMRSVLDEDPMIQQLRDLARLNPSALWLAVDTNIRHEGHGPQALEHILSLSRTGGTFLPGPLGGRLLRNDEEYEQLAPHRIQPRLIGLASVTGIAWRPQG